MGYFLKLWYILQGTRKKLPLMIVVFIASSMLEALGIGLIQPFLNLASEPDLIYKNYFISSIFNQSNLNNSSQIVPILGLFIATLFCVKLLLSFLAKFYILRFSYNFQAQLSSRLLNTYLAVPYTFFLRKNTAGIIKNITYETMRINHFCMQPLLHATANIIVISILLILLAKTDLFLLVTILLIMLPTFLLFYRLKNKFKKWGKQSSESNQEMIRVTNHSLGGFKETRIIGCENYFQHKMMQQTQKFAYAATRNGSFSALPRIIIETLLIVLILLFVSISQIFFNQNIQDIISVMAVFAVTSIRLIPAASQSMQVIGQLHNSSYSVDSIYLDFKELEKEKDNKIGVKNFPNNLTKENTNLNELTNQVINFESQIEFKNVNYKYPGSSVNSLNNISLKINKGEFIALIGKSGAGKTTIVDILLGLLYPGDGDILVDNTSIYKNVRAWQNLVGYIPQSIFLMDETIERNIAFGVPDDLIDSEKLHNAIKAAQLQEFIEELPLGIKTVVGERGIRLSGGQRQRIGIARTLYHEREILILDEATSALDNETEKLVSNAINSLSGKKTLIVIAHRLSTIAKCDQVYMLDKGNIVQSGSYQEVISQ
ncbi:ABC transporter ATP-binding protein [Calothrix rhizosoleniae]|uniref:ABC transporter ATP-binding protein n=1 Tax=Calothrix rhizosoleniae TaxID=888997 RepID=UPI000B4A354A|nr:ABC transporter ATP-binding protein [Calothrix rhizosoleniae]